MKYVPSPSGASLAASLLLAFGLAACGDSGAPAKPAAALPSKPAKPAGEGERQASEPAKAAKESKSGASANLAYQTALQLLLKGDPERARGELERAVSLDASHHPAQFELGRLFVHFSSQVIGSQARDQNLLDQGILHLEKARDLAPDEDHYWFWVGRARALKNDPEEAQRNLRKAVEIEPKNGAAWKALGLVQKNAADLEAARASFEQAIASDPEDAGSFFQLGQTLEATGKPAEARAAYEKSLELDPTEPEVFGRLTQVCAMLGDAACEERARGAMEAWSVYEKRLMKRRYAVKQNPSDALALQRLGELYFEVGKYEEALEWFMKSIHIDPKNPLAHLYCGSVRRQLKDYVNGANHLKEAEFLAPDNLDPKLELLRLYADSEDSLSLNETLARVEREAAEDGASLFDLAELCREIGRESDAARLFEKAKALGVTSAPRNGAAVSEEE